MKKKKTVKKMFSGKLASIISPAFGAAMLDAIAIFLAFAASLWSLANTPNGFVEGSFAAIAENGPCPLAIP